MFFFATDIGRRRINNQDAILINEDNKLVVLADGMGGHSCGEIASNLAVRVAFSSITNELSKLRHLVNDKVINILVNAGDNANKAVITHSNDFPECSQMGTTLVEAIIVKNKLYIYNIGDSKCLLLRGSLVQLTEDHTIASMLKRHGTSPLNIPSNAHHALTQAIGLNDTIFPATNVVPLKRNDLLLFCTDGLTDMLSNRELADILLLPISIEKKGHLLIEKANIAGGNDNITLAIYHHN